MDDNNAAAADQSSVSNTSRVVDFTTPLDLRSLNGKSVLITGGAVGLGKAFAEAFAKAGVIFVQADVTDWDASVAAFKAAIQFSPHKAIDIVVPNAGLTAHSLLMELKNTKPSLEVDPERPPINTIEVDLIGVYYTAKLALHYFGLPPSENAPKGKKQIVFISSLGGYLELSGLADYMASKFGVRGLWKALRSSITTLGIQTNLIAPTFMRTPMTKAIAADLEAKGVRFGRIEDAVDAMMRLASDDRIDGRAIAVGTGGSFDLRDDFDGMDAGFEIREYCKRETRSAQMAAVLRASHIKPEE
ncbi:MAG: hypothetical protein M1819_003202 [Sarea resinae]|nr:MAG: hypothetical protein M1819_003202 [Sarea resinae]